LPSRNALQDTPIAEARNEDIEKLITDEEVLTGIRRAFMAHSQKAMNLPLLKDLSVSDVVEVRSLPEWNVFKDKQAAILKNPLQCLELIEDFQQNFDHFQRALSAWYNEKYQKPRTKESYFNHVSVALSLGGTLIVAGADLGDLQKTLAGFTMDRLTGYIPEKVKGYTVKLLVNVYDAGSHRLDRNRSYSIDIMRSNQELMREDVEYLLNKVRKKRAELPALQSEKLADQGKQ
jgi:hypothetical protein